MEIISPDFGTWAALALGVLVGPSLMPLAPAAMFLGLFMGAALF